MDMGKKGLYMIQSLVFAYLATGILLCLLAFIIYQSNAGLKIATLGVTFTYILASFNLLTSTEDAFTSFSSQDYNSLMISSKG